MDPRNTGSNSPNAADRSEPRGPGDPCRPSQVDHPTDAAFLETGAESPAAEIAALQQKLVDAEQSWLRAQADLENYRKRVRRDQVEERRYALLPILEDLLPVLDNFQRALTAMQGAPKDFLLGVQMVARQFQDVLSKHDCHLINAEGAPFDPAFHEAIGQEPSDQYPPQTVLRVEQEGYRLHDRVIRPAKVVVASPGR